MFESVFKNKKILITGHTGFKGVWLTTWLLKMGAKVVGISKDIPSRPSAFEVLNLQNKITHYYEDVRNLEPICKILKEENPDFIFHLAAQAIVSESYKNPIETIQTNVIGTSNVLESIRRNNKPCIAIMITSDKCYENVEWCWGYKESDRLGGKDIYSASKGAAEVIFHAYQQSFFKENKQILIASARAGNVIGGGDWAQDRIVADCFRAWSENKPVSIRCPQATRPWQHVLEPLSGYLQLACKLSQQPQLNGESYNFGPRAEQNHTVERLILDLFKIWGPSNNINPFIALDNRPFHEAGLLKLNCDKALFDLKWMATMSYDQNVEMVGEWYAQFYKDQTDMYQFTLSQIEKYESLAELGGIVWTQN